MRSALGNPGQANISGRPDLRAGAPLRFVGGHLERWEAPTPQRASAGRYGRAARRLPTPRSGRRGLAPADRARGSETRGRQRRHDGGRDRERLGRRRSAGRVDRGAGRGGRRRHTPGSASRARLPWSGRAGRRPAAACARTGRYSASVSGRRPSGRPQAPPQGVHV